MDSVNLEYRDIVEKLLQEYIDFLGNDDLAEVKLVLDEKCDRYLLVETGWQNGRRIYGNLIHIEIIDNKLWIEHDGTEDGVAYELMVAGIPDADIVLAFKLPELQKVRSPVIS
ncbi:MULTISPECIES: XisI protein [unclassified Microcoleus]|uniref:XisI protein n=1 Tax=unclassified Microcoleus TaxID=2642155 RepID=UPI002FCFCE75